jgi:ubiquinol-cytochrome c reductase cytochrome b subunit
MMAIGFLGYVLPYGQMSLWGSLLFAPNAFFRTEIYLNFIFNECLGCVDTTIFANHTLLLVSPTGALFNLSRSLFFLNKKKRGPRAIKKKPNVRDRSTALTSHELASKKGFRSPDGLKKIRSENRIGPHNIDIISIIFGTLLGDGYGEKRINGTRISFYQEGSHKTYLLWLHSLISNLGYCNSTEPKLQKRLGVKNKIRYVIRFKTWTYSSFNWIYDLFYTNNVKIVPTILGKYLTPKALAI